jgi:hypothetical protein
MYWICNREVTIIVLAAKAQISHFAMVHTKEVRLYLKKWKSPTLKKWLGAVADIQQMHHFAMEVMLNFNQLRIRI